MKKTNLCIPLSQDGWYRIEEILEETPLTIEELIEKALILAWHADDAELLA